MKKSPIATMPPPSKITDPSSGSFTAIDLTLNDSSIFIDFNWRVYKDLCFSDHHLIIMENSTIKISKPQTKPSRWNFKRVNLQSYKKLCLTTLIPESNTNQEEPIIHFTNTLLLIANKLSPKLQYPQTQTIVHRGVQKHN